MAPLTSSQLLMLSVPAVAVLLNYLWFKRRRIGAPSDPGDKETPKTDASVETVRNSSVPLDIESKSSQSKCISNNAKESSSAPFQKISQELSCVEDSPNRGFSRSFSAPIPIVLPKELRLTRTLNISDEELDQQIEKLKSSVKKTDPFELINLGKSSGSTSPSQKSNGQNSILPSNHLNTPEIIKVRDTDGTPTKVSNQSLEVVVCENIVEGIDKNISNSPCVEGEEELTLEQEDKVDCCQETGEKIVANEETQLDTDPLCQEISAEDIPEEDKESCRENTEELVQIVQQETVPPSEKTILEQATPCEEMTSTSNKEISEDSPHSPCIENMNSVDNTDSVQQSPPTLIQKVDAFVCSRSTEVTSSVEELTIADNVDKTLPVERHCSVEEKTSSTEERHSSTEEGPASADRVSGTGTGAIPKKIKKKKFKKLDCDLKDLGKKLREKKVHPKNEVPEKRIEGQKSRSDSGCEREEANAHSSGRQSANESPSDAMMVPSSSLSSLNESEGSNDSGKGCSDVITPPPQTNEPPVENVRSFYEFLINKSLVGKLIGKRGSFVNSVYTKTNAHLVVKGHPYDDEQKVCIVEGTKESIAKAMRMVKQRFPKEKLEPFLPQDRIPPSMRIDNFLTLPGGLNLETHVCSVVTPNHLFLQQPGHPTYPNFLYMHNQINILYSSEDVPLLPKPVEENVLCVAFVLQCWTRVVVISADQETETAYVKGLDFGGYFYVHFSCMKQIRQDFYLLPFQAAECFLANIEPVDDEWPEEAFSLVRSLTNGFMVYTHVVALTDENIPIVNCQVLIDMKPIWINKELVKRGYARWIEEKPALETNELPAEGC
ncbi:KH domain-containing protein akap-1 isoform X2 [Coccinella septempunctata]|uniref:KH domain-containing protein akap-1 isoform X2 n=1 Tax=Coccinella septempunctata TaxID=41139 RepID=UPI001D07F725|nr:KH domain-containing protein akap-1 isoform X2 [Coccinella septempunctata]